MGGRDHLTGPYDVLTDDPLVADPTGTYDVSRIVDDPAGRPVFLAWRQWGDDAAILGNLADSAPVRVLPDARLEVDQAKLWLGRNRA